MTSGRSVVVTTTYSGAFTIEHVCKCIEEGLRDEAVKPLGLCPDFAFRLWAATDVDPMCRRLIMSSKYPPEHVFGDVCDRLPSIVIQKMEAAHQVLLSRAQEIIAASGLKGKGRLEVIDELGARCRRKLIQIARKEYKNMGAQCSAYCYIHKRACPIWPPPPEDGVDPAVHLEAGGNICTAFSSQNAQPWRWLHSSAVPCIAWLCSVEAKRPAFLLQECSDNFDTEAALSDIFPLADGWASSVLRLCPQDVGTPMTRLRKYSWTVDTKQFTMKLDFARHFKLAMGSAVVLDGHVYFMDDSRAAAAWAKEQLKRIGIQSGSADGGRWSPSVVLPVGSRMRLQKYIDIKRSCPPSFEPIVDLSQDPRVRPSFTDVMFSLLRGSQPYSFARGRGMTAFEAWGAQCFPHPSLLPSDSVLASTFPFRLVVADALSEGQVFSLMGNAMNARAAGMFLVFGLYFAKRADSDA